MAYETETKQKVSPFQRVSQGIQGAMEGVNWAQQLQLTQEKMKDAAQQRDLLQQQAQATRADMVAKVSERKNEIMGNALTLDDDKQVDAYLQQQAPLLNAYMPIMGQPYDPKAIANDVKSQRTLIGGKGGLWDQFQQAVGQVQSVGSYEGAFGSPEIDKAAENAKQLARQIGKVAPGAVNMTKGSLDAVDVYQQKRQAGRQQLEVAKNTAQTKIALATDDFNKQLSKADAIAYQKQRESLPTLNQRLSKLDKAESLIDKVITGPIAGKDLPMLLQKTGNKNAIALGYYLSAEGVNAIMNFAKEAGVRAIDTEAERQFLLSSIASPTLDADTLKEALRRQRFAIEETKRVIQAKQKWLQTHKNLRDFDPLEGSVDLGNAAPSNTAHTSSGFKLKLGK